MRHYVFLLITVFCVSCNAGAIHGESDVQIERLQFNRDVRPILTDKCLACHGPGSEDDGGGLRLDDRKQTTRAGGVIVAGRPDDSELIRRIESTDYDERMPPVDAHKPLTTAERAILRRWIAEGAEYQTHWAYRPMRRAHPPAAESKRNVIDHIIAQRMEEDGIDVAEIADRITLIRRLSIDLTGIPPTLAEVRVFANDTSEDAWSSLVDRLLASPRYGERMAVFWLDLVRYADTVGYHGDQNISQSPYRDYIIGAFNQNMPYDQFIKEQLAGDLLPDATLSQQIASGYNRLNQTTEEGGAQDREYLAIYFADRVRNVSQVFMGATMGCCQCHDHKYDPYTMKDFYSLGAFFADLDERGKYNGGGRPPQIRVPDKHLQQEIAAADAEIESLAAERASVEHGIASQQPAWEQRIKKQLDNPPLQTIVWIDDKQDVGGRSSGQWNYVTSDLGPVHSGSSSRKQSSDGLIQHLFEKADRQIEVRNDTQMVAWIYLDAENPPTAVMLQFHDGDWNHRAVWGSDDITYGRQPESAPSYLRMGSLPETGKWVALRVPPEAVGLSSERPVSGMAFTQFGGLAYWDDVAWTQPDLPPDPVLAALQVQPDKRSSEQIEAVRKHYFATAPSVMAVQNRLDDATAKRTALLNTAPLTVVSRSVSPREIRILRRGNWMDQDGEIVSPAIPEFLGELATEFRPSRLDLANWLGRTDNVLTARTMTNRIWALLFGRGICTSVDDFGGQGTFPSYPELLDTLALEFVESGWDVKKLIKLIVTSDAYCRTSLASQQALTADPYNDLFARQGRFRLDAEMIRDSVLFTSGLLVERVGGRSVRPYQPAGYYAQLNFPKRVYEADSGENQYRRGLYTHWQRTFLHPMLKAFDAPSREECTAARARSNTPVQALTLLNDPSFVEAARVYAARIMQVDGDVTFRTQWAYENAVSRSPDAFITSQLKGVYAKHLEHYSAHPAEAERLVAEGASSVPADVNMIELAAWTSVARVVFNLHETIMRY